MKPGVAIIGGGWAGLAAAVELVDAGHPVSLFESARHLGGRARAVDWHGIRIDNGQHLMAGAYTSTLALLNRLQTGHLLERHRLSLSSPCFGLHLPGLPAPLHLAAGLLTARGLPFTDKLAAARFITTLKAQVFRLATDTTVSALLADHRQPARLIAHLWEPICVAALNTPVDQASAQIFCNVLRDSLAGPRPASDLLFHRADLGRLLPDAARNYLVHRGAQVHLGSKVSGLQRAGSSYRLVGPETHADRVIVAVHPARLPDLLAGLPELASVCDQVCAYTWQPIMTLWLRLAPTTADLGWKSNYPMLALGPGNAPWVFERSDLAPGLLSMVASAEGTHLAEAPKALLERWLRLLVERVGPLPAVLDWQFITEKRATFACTPDLQRPGNRTPLPGLYLAGDHTDAEYPATLEAAVRSGVKCARLIIDEASSQLGSSTG